MVDARGYRRTRYHNGIMAAEVKYFATFDRSVEIESVTAANKSFEVKVFELVDSGSFSYKIS